MAVARRFDMDVGMLAINTVGRLFDLAHTSIDLPALTDSIAKPAIPKIQSTWDIGNTSTNLLSSKKTS